jgi:hypothetical protein
MLVSGKCVLTNETMAVSMLVALMGAPYSSASHWLLLLVAPPLGFSFAHDATANDSAMNAANNANFFIFS